MDLFNLDRAFARSMSTVRTIESTPLDSTYHQLIGQNNKRIAFNVGIAFSGNQRGKVYITPDQAYANAVNVANGFLLGTDFVVPEGSGVWTMNGTMVGSLDT